MSKFNFLDGDINADMVRQVMDVYNSHEPEYVFYLDSPGGESCNGRVINDLFDMHKDCTTLIASGSISSMALIIFFQAKCHKILMPQTVGLAHKTMVYTTFNSSGPTQVYDKMVYEGLVNADKNNYELYKNIGFNKKELADFEKGIDVLLPYERMKELLKKNKNK